MVGDSCGEVPVKQNDKPSRHPFVVIYRPQNPHRRQFEKTELIIWDPRAKSKFRGQDMLYQDDLTSAQRAVVDFVKKHGFEKHKLHLGRVLIGGEPFKAGRRTPMLLERLPPGFPQDHMSPNGSELDAAIEFVDALASDITNALPAGDPYVEARGFKKVGMNQKKPVDQSAFVEQHGPEELNIKGSSSERAQKRLDCDANIVFHAPRSEHKRHIGWSKCSNHFYEAARQARTQNPQQSMMKFEFRPTMEWYRDQIEEGRGYEHLHVDSWKEFFRTFGVGKQ
ncbi:hypothetical protein SCUCBS95973_007539 [Sporothrix curviconia]|uniref:Uncharacterized protein n=1 Tax=Sporothrix curviconia TaxID=1260050 RepID=A0ABP0CFC5_9PEZI